MLVALLSSSGSPEVRITDLVPPRYAGVKVRIVSAVVYLSEGPIPDVVRGQIQLPQSYTYIFAAVDISGSGKILQAFSTHKFDLRVDQVITIVGTVYYATNNVVQYIPYVLVEDLK